MVFGVYFFGGLAGYAKSLDNYAESKPSNFK
jgi:hypothetical protein